MKALILENDFEIEREVKNFISKHTGLFSQTEEFTNLLSWSPEQLSSEILEFDAIIIKSTWCYSQQVEEFVKLLALHPEISKHPLNIYVFDLRESIEFFQTKSKRVYFVNYEEFFENLKIVFTLHKLFDVVSETLEIKPVKNLTN